MKIDISRLNLTEKDIEDYFFACPHAVMVDHHLPWLVESWIARQYRLPSGIADLVGVTTSNHVVVVEIKNVPADSRAITQVCRYAHDIYKVLEHRPRYMVGNPDGAYVLKAIFAPAFESLTTYYEANACGVYLHEFAVSLYLDTYRAHPENEADVKRYGDYESHIEQIAQDDAWAQFGDFYTSQQRVGLTNWIEHRQEMQADGGDTEHF